MSDLGAVYLVPEPSLPLAGDFTVVAWPPIDYPSAFVLAGEPSLPSTLAINGGAASTADNDVTLTIDAGEPGERPAQMRVSEPGKDGGWQEYRSSRAWRLTPQTVYPTQAKTVRVEFRE